MVKGFAARARAARSLAILLVLMMPVLSACSDGVGDLFGDSPPPPPPPVFVPKAEGGATNGSATADEQVQVDDAYPALGQVPPRPDQTTSPAERQEVAGQLVADRRHAQYTREQLTGAMSDGGDPAPRGAPSAAAVPPAPVSPPADTSTEWPDPRAASTASRPAQESTDTVAAAAEATPAPPSAPAPVSAPSGTTPSSPAPQDTAPPRASPAAQTVVPPPPSAGASSVGGDEAANVQRVVEGRAALTAGTERGSEMVSRDEQPVLQRTERLTAALNDPAAGSTQVDEFTRRMADSSPAAHAVPPGTYLDDRNDTRPARPAAGAGAVPEVSSQYADRLLAAQAAAELDAYAVSQVADEATVRPPAPVMSPVPAPAEETAELEEAARRALDEQAARASQAGTRVVDEVSVVREVTPEGRVTTETTEMVALIQDGAAAARQTPSQPTVQQAVTEVRRPQTLAEIYEAQLRAAGATSLQQAQQEGAALAAMPVAPAPVPLQPRPVQQVPMATAGAGQQGTVVVSGSGVTRPTASPMIGGAPSISTPGIAPQGVGQQGIKAGTIRFAAGSSRLGGNDVANLRRIAERYREHGGMVRVVGHSSSRTGDMPPEQHRAVNFEASLARAEAVARQLQQFGVPAQSMIVEARSDLEPIYFEAMPAAEAANRRAEIYFIY